MNARRDPMNVLLLAMRAEYPSLDELAGPIDPEAHAVARRLAGRRTPRAHLLGPLMALAAVFALFWLVPSSPSPHAPSPPELPAEPWSGGEGLALSGMARLEGRAVALDQGHLLFARHPGDRLVADEVHWSRLPLVARPVGTVFSAWAEGDAAMVYVEEGTVELLHADGTSLDRLGPGQGRVVWQAGGRLSARALAGLDLGHLGAELPAPEARAIAERVLELRARSLPTGARSLLEGAP